MRIAVILFALGTIFPTLATFAEPIRFGEEVPLSDTRHGEPTSAKFASGLATDGNGYLAVWLDGRGGVFVARIAADGTVLDPAGIPLHTWSSAMPVVAWTGRSYVVTWQRETGVYAATVTSEGVVGPARTVGTAKGNLRIASTGSSVAITAADDNGATLFLLDLDLNRIAEHVNLPRANFPLWRLEIAALRDGYLVAAVSRKMSVYTFTVNSSGAVSAPAQIPESEGAAEVAVAGSGDRYFVAWSVGGRSIRGRVITQANQPVGDMKVLEHVVVPTADPRMGVGLPMLVSRDGEYLLTYRDGNTDVHMARVTEEGNRIGPSTVIARVGAGFYAHARIAARSDGSGAAFYIAANAPNVAIRPLIRLFSSADQPELGEPIPLQHTAHEQVQPAAEQIGATSVVTWVERTLGSVEIRLQMSRRELVVARPLVEPDWLDVVEDGGTIWVLWVTGDSKKLHLRRFTPELAAIDSDLRQVSLPEKFARVMAAAAGGGSVLIVSDTDDGRDLVGTVLRPSGDEIDVVNEIDFAVQPHADYRATVAFDGTNFVVVWNHELETMPWLADDHDLQLARISPEGAKLDHEPIELAGIRADHRGFAAAQVIQANGRTVVLWQRTTGTYAAFLNGTTLGEVKQVHSLDVDDHRLREVVALPDGSLDLYYAEAETFELPAVHYRHDRVSAALTTASEPQVIAEVAGLPPTLLDFAATANGSSPRLIYARRPHDPQYGSVERLFVRTGSVGTSRRRAVR
jgi:hypothetical protein